jgi:ABC-type nitrate/sulfonate/bicarbonate transport system permease component
MNTLKNIFIPFKIINKQTIFLLIVVEVMVALISWQFFGGCLIPTPFKISESLINILSNKNFYHNLVSSSWLTVKGMFISVLISLILGYFSRIPFFKPMVKFVVKCRYLTITGLIFLFTLLTHDGSQLKISLLVFGIVPFFVTSLVNIFDNIDI